MSTVLTRVHRDSHPALAACDRSDGAQPQHHRRPDRSARRARAGRRGRPGEALDGQARKWGVPGWWSLRWAVTILAVQVDVDPVVTALVGLGGRIARAPARPWLRTTWTPWSELFSDVCHDLLTTAAPPTSWASASRCRAHGRRRCGARGPNLGWIDAPGGAGRRRGWSPCWWPTTPIWGDRRERARAAVGC